MAEVLLSSCQHAEAAADAAADTAADAAASLCTAYAGYDHPCKALTCLLPTKLTYIEHSMSSAHQYVAQKQSNQQAQEQYQGYLCRPELHATPELERIGSV
jgi:hypothetical protein